MPYIMSMTTHYNTITITPKDTCSREVRKPSVVNISRGFFLEGSMIIYKATNLINSKVYIGQTVKSLKHRKAGHFSKIKKNSKTYFHNAIRRYGKNNFKWQVICACPNIDSLNEQEEYYIKFYNSNNPKNGYNLNEGGLNYNVGRKLSKKTREKQSDARVGMCFSKEHKQKISNAHKGKVKSDKHKKNLSMAMKKYFKENPCGMLSKKHSAKTRKKISLSLKGKNHPMYGKHPSVETIKRMSIAQSGDNHPMYGRHHSEETKKKMSIATRGTNNPHYGKKHSKEAKKKMSDARKHYWKNKRNENNI